MEETMTLILVGVVIVLVETVACGIYAIYAGEDSNKENKDKHQCLPLFLDFLIILVIAIISPAVIGINCKIAKVILQNDS